MLLQTLIGGHIRVADMLVGASGGESFSDAGISGMTTCKEEKMLGLVG